MGCVGLSWGWGGMGELAVVNDYNVALLPKGVSDIQGAMIEPAAVAVYAVDRGNVRSGDTVLVSGVGPIGALTLLAVKAAGAGQIFRCRTQCLPPQDGEGACAVTAIIIDPMTENVAEKIHDMTEEGVGVDVAIECVGLEASLNTCVASVRRQGRVVQTGLHMKPASIDAMLVGVEGHHPRSHVVLPRAVLAAHHPHGGVRQFPDREDRYGKHFI